jgi:hypothetical protein
MTSTAFEFRGPLIAIGNGTVTINRSYKLKQCWVCCTTTESKICTEAACASPIIVVEFE